jgi:hypothetical protein
MTPSRKKPGVAFWATVVVVVLVLYVASFGPACWLSSRTGTGVRALPIIYRPITSCMRIEDFPFRGTSNSRGPAFDYFYPTGPINRFAELWAAEHWKWRLVVEREDNTKPLNLDDGYWRWCDATK